MNAVLLNSQHVGRLTLNSLKTQVIKAQPCQVTFPPPAILLSYDLVCAFKFIFFHQTSFCYHN